MEQATYEDCTASMQAEHYVNFSATAFLLPSITTRPVVHAVVINSYISAYTEIINKGIYSS